MQAKTMFEASSLSAPSVNSASTCPQPKKGILGNATKVSFAQTIKEGKQHGPAVFPPKLRPTNIPLAPKPKEDWQTVQHKKATRQGTKATMVSAVVPVMHQVPRVLMLATTDDVLTAHFLDILELVPGVKNMLANNQLKCVHWSLNRDILHASFACPIDDNLQAPTHHAFRQFFNVSNDSEPQFIERPTVSSIKWAHVPCFNADNNEISEWQLANQILKVVQGPLWIVPSTGNKGSYTTVKLDFEDNWVGSNLKILLNKNIFLNDKVCHMLPWVNQNSTPQCTQCLRWGHS